MHTAADYMSRALDNLHRGEDLENIPLQPILEVSQIAPALAIRNCSLCALTVFALVQYSFENSRYHHQHHNSLSAAYLRIGCTFDMAGVVNTAHTARVGSDCTPC